MIQPELVSISPTVMALSKNSYLSNWSSENSSDNGSGMLEVPGRLDPTAELFLTQPEYALCRPIGPVVEFATMRMPYSHCLSSSCGKLLFSPSNTSAFLLLSWISCLESSVVANAVSKALNSTHLRISGEANANSLSPGEETPQNSLKRRNFSITALLQLDQTVQKDWARVNSVEGEYALQEDLTMVLLELEPIINRLSERGRTSNVFKLSAIYSGENWPTSGRFRKSPDESLRKGRKVLQNNL